MINASRVDSDRYPTFIDALRDVDDALAMCFLFSTFARTGKCHVQTIQLCRRLSVEWMNYIVASRSLKKVGDDIRFKRGGGGGGYALMLPCFSHHFCPLHATSVPFTLLCLCCLHPPTVSADPTLMSVFFFFDRCSYPSRASITRQKCWDRPSPGLYLISLLMM